MRAVCADTANACKVSDAYNIYRHTSLFLGQSWSLLSPVMAGTWSKQSVWIAFRSMEFRSRLSKAVLPSHLQLWCLRYLVPEHTACCTTSSALYMPFSVTHEYYLAWHTLHIWHSLNRHNYLHLTHGSCVGELPISWAEKGAFSMLANIPLVSLPINGTLPSAWAGNGSLPSLLYLELGITHLAGVLPPARGSASAFANLQMLLIYNASITGRLVLTMAAPAVSRDLCPIHCAEKKSQVDASYQP